MCLHGRRRVQRNFLGKGIRGHHTNIGYGDKDKDLSMRFRGAEKSASSKNPENLLHCRGFLTSRWKTQNANGQLSKENKKVAT